MGETQTYSHTCTGPTQQGNETKTTGLEMENDKDYYGKGFGYSDFKEQTPISLLLEPCVLKKSPLKRSSSYEQIRRRICYAPQEEAHTEKHMSGKARASETEERNMPQSSDKISIFLFNPSNPGRQPFRVRQDSIYDHTQ